MSEQTYRDVLSRLEAKDKQPMTTDEVYDALSFLPGTGDVIGAYEAPAIIQAGVDKMGEDSLIEKAKGVGIATLGGMGFLPVVGGPARKAAKIFSKIDTPVYHYSPDVQLNFTKFDPDRSPSVIDSLGVHVGTKQAARDRFETRMNLGTGQLPGIDDMPTGNVGYGPDGRPIPRTTFGGTFPLLADTTKPFTPKGSKQWSEFDLNEHLINEFNKTLPKGQDFDGYYTMKHLSAEPGYEDFPFAKFREFVKDYRKKLAKDGFTHIPYLNDVEDPGSVSLIMLVDRPKGSTKVLQSPFAKKDPSAADDPDIMKQEGGVVEMKDKAVNMYRDTQGIEPFIKYMV